MHTSHDWCVVYTHVYCAQVYRKFKAHDGVCIGAIWHPIEQVWS